MAESPLLEPPLLRRLERLALRVRRAVQGQMGGERRSVRRGRSPEFADFRTYTPGDDYRLIDWNAYARLDRFMLRLFVAEEELPLSLFVDLSGSMDWGTPNKAMTARRLAARQPRRVDARTVRGKRSRERTGRWCSRRRYSLFPQATNLQGHPGKSADRRK